MNPSPVIELIRRAADDQVVAIKDFVPTGPNSPIVTRSSKRQPAGGYGCGGTQARFDEKANISLATRRRKRVQVVYGIVGYKTHAKMLILRREAHLRHAIHLSTGNYHLHSSYLPTMGF